MSAVAACRQPRGSIAAMALSRLMNAILLRRWVVEAERLAEGSRRHPQTNALLRPPDRSAGVHFRDC